MKADQRSNPNLAATKRRLEMSVDRVFVFEYQRRGSTRLWDAIDPGRVEKADPDDEWEDGEVQFEREGGRVFIRV
jgi:hypothetical protein